MLDDSTCANGAQGGSGVRAMRLDTLDILGAVIVGCCRHAQKITLIFRYLNFQEDAWMRSLDISVMSGTV